MKKITTHVKKIISIRKRFLGTMLLSSLIMYSSATSQLLPVNLGSTSNYVILAGSLVSNVPTSAVTGDIGLSPAAGSNITGFGLTELTGKFFAVDATGPVGSTISATILTLAKGDLTIAYNDAAGRTPVPTGTFLNPGSGNIGGMTLVPGLYKFTSTAAITGSDLTLTGSATDVWIFQIAASLNVGNGVHVVLAGGAKAANIFWQVGTSATLGTTSIFKGTIMADQSISMNSGATVEGRLLASNAAVTISSSTIVRPTAVTIVKQGSALNEFALLQNFPNPFNPSTMIQYSLEKPAQVSLKIYSLIGSEVATLVQGHEEAGSYSVSFHAKSGTLNLPSGVYFYRLEAHQTDGGQAGSFVSTKKLTLMK